MTLPIYNLPKDGNIGSDQSAVPTVFASGVSPDSIPWSTTEEIIRDIVREGPFDAGATPMDTEDSPLIITGMPGCPYRMTSYTGTALQLHHPRFLEFIGAPESARLLNHSPSFWVNRLGQECAMAAAVNLQRDAGLMMSNLQILAQFVTTLHRMSSEMMSIGVGHVVFPVEEVEKQSMANNDPRYIELHLLPQYVRGSQSFSDFVVSLHKPYIDCILSMLYVSLFCANKIYLSIYL